VSVAEQLETPVDLAASLTGRAWTRHSRPFPWIGASDVFTAPVVGRLRAGLAELRSRGLSEVPDPARLSRNMRHSDAYSWNLPADVGPPFDAFCTASWHGLVSRLFGVETTGDLNVAVHLHQPHSATGSVHRDLGEGWFSDQPRPDGVNVMDLRRCGYTSGAAAPGVPVRRTARAVTMIYYLGNPGWRPDDGGGTGLYDHPDDDVDAPRATVEPLDNSALLFENTPDSWHSYLGNGSRERTSVILWAHRRVEDAERRWGRGIVSRW
jgi:hypothetical protein